MEFKLDSKNVSRSIGYFLFFLILIGCSYSHIEINSQTDQNEGRKFAEETYTALMFHEDNEAILSSTIGDKGKFTSLLERIKTRMGTLESYEIKSVETKRVERNFLTMVDYMVKIHVRYTKGDSDEVLGLTRKGNDKIWINGYKVYSDLML